MQIDESGKIVDNNISVEDFTKKLIISESTRKQKQEKLFKNEPVLKIKNLKTYFPIRNGFFGGISSHVKAVDDVCFEVYPGETLGLVGESGCGKTTIGRTILRLEEPTSGEMIYKGQDISLMTAEELRLFRKEVQIIFQDPYSSLNPRMTIGNAIMEPMQVHKILKSDVERKKRVEELLERVNLDPTHFYRYPHEFSGGQRQRIGIARALAVNPKFIICDESVSALDVSVQAQVLNLLNELKDEFGLTYIFISHDLSVVKYMSDRMVVMQEGKIEEMGDADQIYNNPKTKYTQKLIDAVPEGKIEDIKKHLESKGVIV
jgi:peptide/nickel transport system ATP-binding protein